MKPASFAVFLSLALLTGCGLKSPVQREQMSLPADWKQAGGFPVAAPAKDLSRWWNRFDDPTLSRIIASALQNSPDMASASARVREAKARRVSTASALLPTVSGSVSGGASASDRDSSGRESGDNYSAGLNASWELDFFGKNRARVEAASAQIGATEENFNSVKAALASEIAIAYTNLRVGEAGLVVLHDTIKSREETEQLASWRTQAGEADSLESSQALSSLEQARAAVPSLEQSIAQAKNLLALLAGQNPGGLDGMLAAGKQAIPNPERSLAVGIPADTLRQRPDVRLAGYQLLAQAATSRAVDAERFPSFDLSGSLGLNTLTATKLFNPQTTSASVIAGVTSPIFDAGRIKANIEAQNAVEEQTWQTYRSTVLGALSEVEDSLIACRRSTERLAILEKATAAAREAADLAQKRYQAGVTDILTVLDSQRSLLGLENNLFSVRADRAVAYIQLYKALGGGWS